VRYSTAKNYLKIQLFMRVRLLPSVHFICPSDSLAMTDTNLIKERNDTTMLSPAKNLSELRPESPEPAVCLGSDGKQKKTARIQFKELLGFSFVFRF
jgi:hypothetical protein